ncbi:hypothetical protein BDR03DRAFT_960431 [Suillus americanus]|nr:hypothetical protein BDR03DRAFT_960431 [Suillus americanus]
MELNCILFLSSLQKPTRTIKELVGGDVRCNTLVHLRPTSPSINVIYRAGTSHVSPYSSHRLNFISRSLALAQYPVVCSRHSSQHPTRMVFILVLSFSPLRHRYRDHTLYCTVNTCNELHIPSYPVISIFSPL